MLFCCMGIIIDGGFVLALKCSGNGIVSGFKSTFEDEKGSGMIKHSEEESASLWRKCACHGICLFVCL